MLLKWAVRLSPAPGSLTVDLHRMLLILLPLTVAVLHPSLPTARLAHAHALVGRARDTYSVVATKHYLATAAASSGILRAGADLAGQCARDGAADPTHTLSMAAVATVVSGLCGAQWMRHLDSTLGDSTAESAGLVAAKAFADYTCFAPCANSVLRRQSPCGSQLTPRYSQPLHPRYSQAYLFLLPLLTGAGVEAATTSVVAHLPFLMQARIDRRRNVAARRNLLSAATPADLPPLTPCRAARVHAVDAVQPHRLFAPAAAPPACDLCAALGPLHRLHRDRGVSCGAGTTRPPRPMYTFACRSPSSQRSQSCPTA